MLFVLFVLICHLLLLDRLIRICTVIAGLSFLWQCTLLLLLILGRENSPPCTTYSRIFFTIYMYHTQKKIKSHLPFLQVNSLPHDSYLQFSEFNTYQPGGAGLILDWTCSLCNCGAGLLLAGPVPCVTVVLGCCWLDLFLVLCNCGAGLLHGWPCSLCNSGAGLIFGWTCFALCNCGAGWILGLTCSLCV
jgi:hypothetical protein